MTMVVGTAAAGMVAAVGTAAENGVKPALFTTMVAISAGTNMGGAVPGGREAPLASAISGVARGLSARVPTGGFGPTPGAGMISDGDGGPALGCGVVSSLVLHSVSSSLRH